MSIMVDVVRVFTTEDGRHGNPLGIVDGSLIHSARRQSVAAELGYSETVFIDDPATGAIQIFTPTMELPFAGHPTVGSAWWLAEHDHPVTSLRVAAGEVHVTRDGPITRVRARPEWAPEFALVRLDSVEQVLDADPDAAAEGGTYLWAWLDEQAGAIRSRMFASGLGVREDEATGAAAVRITAMLRRDLDITQGEGSRLHTRWSGDGWVTLGGRVLADASVALP